MKDISINIKHNDYRVVLESSKLDEVRETLFELHHNEKMIVSLETELTKEETDRLIGVAMMILQAVRNGAFPLFEPMTGCQDCEAEEYAPSPIPPCPSATLTSEAEEELLKSIAAKLAAKISV